MATVRRRATLLYGTRAVHLKLGGALRAQGVGGRPRAGALRAHLVYHRGGAAVRETSLWLELRRLPPIMGFAYKYRFIEKKPQYPTKGHAPHSGMGSAPGLVTLLA